MNWLQPTIKGLANAAKRQPLNSSTEIRITRLCSQRCRQCSVYERKTMPSSLSFEKFQIICQKLRDYGAYIGFVSGGEATLVPDLDRMLLEAKKTFPVATTLVTGLYNNADIIEKIGSVAFDNNINIQTSLDGFGETGDSLRGVKNFSDTILGHMKWLAENRGQSKSLLYANIVLNNLNLDQVPDLIKRARDLGWKTTIGLYHTLTETTRSDDDLRIHPGERLDNLMAFLDNNPNIMNLNSFVQGIAPFINGEGKRICAFTDSPVLSTRTTIMENGDVHLCYGNPVGNLFQNTLNEIFSGEEYSNRLNEYRQCSGCWTTCYTQRYLLIHPRSLKELRNNFRKVKGTKLEKK